MRVDVNFPSRIFRRVVLLIMSASLLVMSVGALAFGKKHSYSVEDFFRNPGTSDYQLSDNGQLVAYLKSGPSAEGKNRKNINLRPVNNEGAGSEEKQLTHETERDVAGFTWKGSDTLVYFKDNGGDENFRAYSFNITTGKTLSLVSDKNSRTELISGLDNDPDYVLLQNNNRDKTVFDVYRVNVRTGESTLLIQNPGSITRWVADNNGIIRLAVSTDGLRSVLLYRSDEKAAPWPLISTDYKTDITPLFFNRDNKTFFALSNRGRDKAALVQISADSPDDEKVIFQVPDYDISGAFYSTRQQKLIAVTWTDTRNQSHLFDDRLTHIKKKLEKRLPGMQLQFSPDLNETTFIVYATGDRFPGTYYLYQTAQDSLTRLADENPALDPETLAEVRPISYKSRDGLTIHGYLTLPRNRSPQNLACIVNPHGGPETRDVWSYNPEVQFLAYQGYCVLQINFRGSTGYGRAFWLAGYGQWGLKMQDDITDGVNWLIKEGFAAPGHIGIYGASYGGYATLSGITSTPNLYAAAVDYVGISSLFTVLNSIPPYWKPMQERQFAMIGHPLRDKERLTVTSPLMHADNIKTPLFIAQGANDPRVNKRESDQMVAALKKRGVSVEYMVKEDEGHGFQNAENRIDFYQAMNRFLHKYLPPTPPSS